MSPKEILAAIAEKMRWKRTEFIDEKDRPTLAFYIRGKGSCSAKKLLSPEYKWLAEVTVREALGPYVTRNHHKYKKFIQYLDEICLEDRIFASPLDLYTALLTVLEEK